MVNELAKNNLTSEKIPDPGKRRFLKLLGGLVGAGAAAALGIRPVSAQTPGEIPTPGPTEVEVSIVDSPVEAETVPVVVEKIFGDVRVFLDAEEIPLEYSRGEITYMFTDDEKEYFRQMKELAIERSEPEVIHQELLPIQQHSASFSENGSVITELPSDILDSEVLREAGVTILNNSKELGAPQLYLRESVLEGILEPLVAFNNDATDLGRVEIVPFAGLSISSVHLPESISFDLTRTYTAHKKTVYDNFLNERANSIEQQLQQLRTEMARSSASTDQAQKKAEILTVKINDMLYESTLSEKQIVDEMTMDGDGALGMFRSAYGDYEASYRGLTSQIYFANPTAEQLSPKRILSFYFTDVGLFDVANSVYTPIGGGTPRADVTKNTPSPDGFPNREPGGDYLYAPNGLGFVLFHELAHFITIDVLPQMIKEGTIGQSKLYQEEIATNPELLGLLEELALSMVTEKDERDFKRERTVMEHMADLLAKSYFEKAHAHYKATGDSSLYCFALEVPASNGNPAGWQITNAPRASV